jgi:hypothetical protein
VNITDLEYFSREDSQMELRRHGAIEDSEDQWLWASSPLRFRNFATHRQTPTFGVEWYRRMIKSAFA